MLWWGMTPEYGVNVSRSQAISPIKLPSNATNINYFYGKLGPSDLVEFDLKKQDFDQWAKQQGWVLVQGETRVSRPMQFTGTGQSELLLITQALYYSEYDPDNPDMGFNVAYDLSEERVYYSRHDR